MKIGLMGCNLRFFKSLALIIGLLCGGVNVVMAKVTPEEVAKAFPREVAGFRMVGAVRPGSLLVTKPGEVADVDLNNFTEGHADYVSTDGNKFSVELIRAEQDSVAYSLLTRLAQLLRTEQARGIQLTREIGTTSLAWSRGVAFFKGPTVVVVSISVPNTASDSNLINFAQALAETLPKGEADVPILVKHLPQWESAQTNVVYLAGFRSLNKLIPNQPILGAVTSEGDADAALATYGTAQFLLVEFNTPQLAGDNDRAIAAKLEELRQQGQPLPTSYRKVGNYSVFVFNAATEAEAKNLIDQVEYAQMVTWLGHNPYALEKAQRDYYQTTAGVLISVVIASGLSLVLCFGIGGFIGAVLFSRRRARQRAAEAYSDAGGMLRLNLDDITQQTDPAKLLRP